MLRDPGDQRRDDLATLGQHVRQIVQDAGHKVLDRFDRAGDKRRSIVDDAVDQHRDQFRRGCQQIRQLLAHAGHEIREHDSAFCHQFRTVVYDPLDQFVQDVHASLQKRRQCRDDRGGQVQQDIRCQRDQKRQVFGDCVHDGRQDLPAGLDQSRHDFRDLFGDAGYALFDLCNAALTVSGENLRQAVHDLGDPRHELADHSVLQTAKGLRQVLQGVLEGRSRLDVLLVHDDAEVMSLLSHSFDVFRGGVEQCAHLRRALPEEILGDPCPFGLILDAGQGGDRPVPEFLPAHAGGLISGDPEGLKGVAAVCRSGREFHHGVLEALHARAAVLGDEIPLLIGVRAEAHLLGHLINVIAEFRRSGRGRVERRGHRAHAGDRCGHRAGDHLGALFDPAAKCR